MSEQQIFDYMERFETACIGTLQFKDTFEPVYRVNGEYTVRVMGDRRAITAKYWSVFCDRLREYYQCCSIDLMPHDPVENMIVRLQNF
jgi:hypothetical protein